MRLTVLLALSLLALACSPVLVLAPPLPASGGEGGAGGDAEAGGAGGCAGAGYLDPACRYIDYDCDLDADGFQNASCGGDDCNDKNPDVFPGAPEVCGNQRDDNCNGLTDELCPCAPGDRRSCYPTTDTSGKAVDVKTRAVGACTDGEQICAEDGSTWSACSGAVTPSDEGDRCDGIDENCDGRADEQLVNACGLCGPEPVEVCGNGLDDDCNGVIDDPPKCGPCTAGEERSCYSGPPQTLGRGICHAGAAVCDPDSGSSIRCDGEQLPRFETCGNGEDDDCDGLLDEDDGATAKRCPVVCVADSKEICGDGLDNDCDGRADEGCLATTEVQLCYAGPPMTRGVGACRDGQQEREGAFWGDCLWSVVPRPERCGDGIDSDCNGLGGPGEPEDPGC